MVDNRIITNPNESKEIDKPWQPRHDVDATSAVVKQLLAGGTPDWVKWPEDYKALAQEEFAAHREQSDQMAEQYRFEDQVDLTNKVARKVNPMSTLAFINKLRQNDIKCFIIDNGYPPSTVALWCLPPKQAMKARYICYMQVPAMYEWSVLKLNERQIPIGEDFRGWRTVLIQLIEKEILTEYQAHQIFGYPSGSKVFSRYHQSLWEIRNRRKYSEHAVAEHDV